MTVSKCVRMNERRGRIGFISCSSLYKYRHNEVCPQDSSPGTEGFWCFLNTAQQDLNLQSPDKNHYNDYLTVKKCYSSVQFRLWVSLTVHPKLTTVQVSLSLPPLADLDLSTKVNYRQVEKKFSSQSWALPIWSNFLSLTISACSVRDLGLVFW